MLNSKFYLKDVVTLFDASLKYLLINTRDNRIDCYIIIM